MVRGGRARGAWVVASVVFLGSRVVSAQDEPPAELSEKVHLAAEMCPTAAITVED